MLLQWLMYLSLLAFLFNNDDGKHSMWFRIPFFPTKLCVSCVYICKYWMTPYIHTLILNIFRNDIDKTLHRSHGLGSAIVGIVWIRMPQKWTYSIPYDYKVPSCKWIKPVSCIKLLMINCKSEYSWFLPTKSLLIITIIKLCQYLLFYTPPLLLLLLLKVHAIYRELKYWNSQKKNTKIQISY